MSRGRIRWDLLFVLAAIVLFGLGGRLMVHKTELPVSRAAIGRNDTVYYSREATLAQAESLGQALRATGYFHEANTSVLLSKQDGRTDVSFALQDGAWDRPDTVAAFEEIGRRVASSVGGFPIRVLLTDTKWSARRTLRVGKVLMGAHDAVYYMGSATEEDATALALALTDAGYLGGAGATVVLDKDGGTAIGFVVGNGVWDRPDVVAEFEKLARKVAGSVGGPPVELRLLDAEMQRRKTVKVE